MARFVVFGFRWQSANFLLVQNECRTLDKTISSLEMELAAARAAQDSILNGSPLMENVKLSESGHKKKYLMVVGINTAFSNRKRRDSVRATWMPQGLAIYHLHIIIFSLD